MTKYTIAETFVGCGGCHLGFKQNGFKTIFVNDNNKNMIDTLLINNMVKKEEIILDSIENINDEILKKYIYPSFNLDVLFGGIVCKGFSLAGVRNPFDKRNYFYKYQLELVKKIKPKISIIENVIGFKNMILYRKNEHTINSFIEYTKLVDLNKKYNGEKSALRKLNKPYKELQKKIKNNKIFMKNILKKIDKYKYNIFNEIIKIYNELDYKVYHKILSANKYSGYTSRKRLIIVAVRNDINKEYHFPKEHNTSYTLKDALNKIDYNDINNIKNDIDNRPMTHKKKTIDRFKYIPEGKNIADIINILPDELKISKFYSRGNTQRLDRNKICPTLVPGHSNFPIHPTQHRSITVREAATITGFPLNYKFVGSHTSRCMQVGNAVPVYLANALARSIIKILE